MSNPFDLLRERLTEMGEVKAKNAVQRLAFETSAEAALLTPVDTSNLINSRFVSVNDYLGFIEGRVGYTARYARAVANMSGKLKGQPRAHFGRTSNRSEFGPIQAYEFGGGTGRGRYWDPDAEPDFLNKGAKRAIDNAWPAIVNEELKV